MNFIKFPAVVRGIQHLKVHADFGFLKHTQSYAPLLPYSVWLWPLTLEFNWDLSLTQSTVQQNAPNYQMLSRILLTLANASRGIRHNQAWHEVAPLKLPENVFWDNTFFVLTFLLRMNEQPVSMILLENALHTWLMLSILWSHQPASILKQKHYKEKYVYICILDYWTTVNFLNIRTPKIFVVITLKFELCGSTIK